MPTKRRAEVAKGPAARSPAARSPKPGGRGRLSSMRVSDGFREFVVDQLTVVGGIRPQPMFGGIGLYADDLFFGIVAADILYFKVDDSNRADYEAAGSSAFTPYKDRAMTMSYYRVPADVLEDAAVLEQWARRAIAVAKSSAQGKKRRRSPIRVES